VQQVPRRLIDQNPRREARRQGLILDRLEVGFRNRIRAELIRAMEDMIRVFELTGEVPPARDHYQRLEDAYRAMAVSAATTFGGRIIQQGKDAGLALETKDFAQTMARLALAYIGQEVIRRRITQVAETTRAQIVAAVARGYAEGLGQDGVGHYVRSIVSDMATWRANMIARTETHGAANFGAQEAAKETGLPLMKEWISAEDERTREDHVTAGNEYTIGGSIGPIPQNEPFIVGGEALQYPGDPAGSAGNAINCRCSVGWIVQDD
jgi:uncharacterized protein with gpF-like domain